jgi:aldehyde dehydrogenase (NAD+)
MKNAADTIKRVTLELGGEVRDRLPRRRGPLRRDPAGARCGLHEQRAACVAGTRLVVPNSRMNEVKAALLKPVPTFKIGDPLEPGVATGPMVTGGVFGRI